MMMIPPGGFNLNSMLNQIICCRECLQRVTTGPGPACSTACQCPVMDDDKLTPEIRYTDDMTQNLIRPGEHALVLTLTLDAVPFSPCN